MNNKSKFAGLVKARRGEELTEESAPASVDVAEPTPQPQRGPGRPRGKRSSEQYVQLNTFVDADVYDEVKIALIKRNRRRKDKLDVGGLLTELMKKWLEENPTS